MPVIENVTLSAPDKQSPDAVVAVETSRAVRKQGFICHEEVSRAEAFRQNGCR